MNRRQWQRFMAGLNGLTPEQVQERVNRDNDIALADPVYCALTEAENRRAAQEEIDLRDAVARRQRQERRDGGRLRPVILALVALLIIAGALWLLWPEKKIVTTAKAPVEQAQVVVKTPEPPSAPPAAQQQPLKVEIVGEPLKVEVGGVVKVEHSGKVDLNHSGKVKVVVKKPAPVVSKPRAQATPPPAAAPQVTVSKKVEEPCPPTPVQPAPAPAVVQPPPAPSARKIKPVPPESPIGPCKFNYGPEYQVRNNGAKPPHSLVEWAISKSRGERIQRIDDPQKCEIIDRYEDNKGNARQVFYRAKLRITYERIRRPDGTLEERKRDENAGYVVQRFQDDKYLRVRVEDQLGVREEKVFPLSKVPEEQRIVPPHTPDL